MNAKTQAAANCNLFASLKPGQFFTTNAHCTSRIPFRLHERYMKVNDETVQCSDGRQWPFACTEGSGSSVVMVPEGSPSCAPYDMEWKK